ncbi:BPSS1780 family membrane protein [Denitratisoma oestradiolicum]|uniref:Transmembrane protein n=1 Tax=Denitratisoma oestradiolicum TaxID=311182 RepID=A0A6S6XZ70_9PROT|nr:BPSS1780 family membrane protein [Denitratisoma oestradiolicum]TWO79314.1 hypothetical protein CBW56_15510 [Denitratisoma oestradiolicum]CAB1370358.1 conserved membrane protein of unknown function [Denitratisoma oestradiolicum]
MNAAATMQTQEPKTVGVERAMQWLAEGWRLFRAAPAIWIALTVVLFVINILLNLVPVLGGLAAALLMPVFFGGLMAGCAAQARDEDLQFDTLFAGFRTNTASLMTLGLLSVAAMVVIALLAFLVGGGAMMGSMMGRGMDPAGGATLALGGMLMASLLVLALSVPVAMALWFAVPLVMLGNVAPVAALKSSFSACLKNMLPFLVYGVVVFVLTFIAAIPFGLGLLVLVPVVIASIYASYRDIFP